jgi:hypothetical protein
MPQLPAGVDRGGTRRDRTLARQAAAAVVASIALAPLLPGPAQVGIQRPPGRLLGPDVAVDRLVADRQDAIAAQPPGHLFRAPVLPHQLLHPHPVGPRDPPIASGPGASPPRVPVRQLRAIAAVVGGAVPAQLAANGTPMTAQDPGDCRRHEPLPPKHTEGVPFSGGDLAVGHGRLPSLGRD